MVGLMESREMPFVWLWNRLRRRGDLLVVRADLQRRPTVGFELYDARSVVAGDARRAAEAAGWQPELGADGLWRALSGPAAATLAEQLLATLGPYRPRLERLAVRPQTPHLVVALSLAGLRVRGAPPLDSTLVKLAEGIARPRTTEPGA
jgi:hypothetical protein